MLDQAAIRRLVQRVENGLEEVVGFFQLIPKHLVVLRKLKGFEVQLLDDLKAQRIEARKQPATAGGFLVGHLARFQLDGKNHGVVDGFLLVFRRGGKTAFNNGFLRNLIGTVCGKCGAKTAQHAFRNVGIHEENALLSDLHAYDTTKESMVQFPLQKFPAFRQKGAAQ